nr:GatB/YqeY domain-containing protein [Ardenticatena sp.]
MSLKERLQQDLKEALRNRGDVRRNTIRLLLTAIKNAEIEHGSELSDEQIMQLLQKQAKQRRDSIEQYRRGGRDDLVAEESAELAIIEEYLPRQLSEDEIRAEAQAHIEAVGATSPRDMGKVMGPLMAKLRGRADGALVQKVVRELLAERSAS